MREDLAKLLTDTVVPPANLIGKLPRISCRDCSDAQGKVCSTHSKQRCNVCDNWITTAHVHLDYLGHAEVTRILSDHDPEWTWEPVAWDGGRPAIQVVNKRFVMWGWLTVHGHRRLGVGIVEADKGEADKELIGDFLRNAAMRFGVGLSLWSKQEWDDDAPEPQPAPPQAPPDWREKFMSACVEAKVDVTDVCLLASENKLSLPRQFKDEERFKLAEALATLKSGVAPVAPEGGAEGGIPPSATLGSRARK